MKISAEHYISKGVLRAIMMGEKGLLRFSGAAWLPRGSERLLPPEALASKILCRRHNSLLHHLDDAALALMRAFVRTFDTEERSDQNSLILASGAAFEAWAMKTAVGCLYSGTLADKDGGYYDKKEICTRALIESLRNQPLPFGCGIYMNVEIGAQVDGHPPFQIRALGMNCEGRDIIVGADLDIFNIKFRIITDPRGSENMRGERDWAFRPGTISFERPDYVSAIVLTWADAEPHGSVRIALRPSDSLGDGTILKG